MIIMNYDYYALKECQSTYTGIIIMNLIDERKMFHFKYDEQRL